LNADFSAQKERLEDIGGILCKILIPVREEVHLGKGALTAICTLGDMHLLRDISESDLMERICIVGRLFSENKGIERLVHFTLSHDSLRKIIVCGKEVPGHLPGQALLALCRFGVDDGGKIFHALGHRPYLKIAPIAIQKFREQVEVIDAIGTSDIDSICRLVP